MAKAKTESLPNRHMYTRVSYLHQAACYLSTVQPTTPNSNPTSQEEPHDNAQADRGKHSASETVARRLVSDIRAVSLKAQIRPSPAVKQMMCKYCDSLLVEGKTCSTTVENLSKGGKKPWADVMVTKCKACGNVKRFPVNAARQKRRPFREAKDVGKDVEMTQPADTAPQQAIGGE
ncbi:RNAse P Rpr2/Rpp21/SNM1 subunit domain-containing protein [Colletotrichum karsti]|uniref:RNAse P Rpr2/Rpp21/SNM1 subunit domain-containing protein n=1 Tax=Colletotrichum karsti TaxID=1095194 RepID=A0A9P6LN31_9PEZI|nr:RNAse P Rpr2/Rpp21/SNM1 subunit domain-containing protein [Colletotrichum karsti]KAF9879463.1 RNAse P Rpr2/Rpp21/SNM1 subunit domain-containing protein [Colletotrichum karsti]